MRAPAGQSADGVSHSLLLTGHAGPPCGPLLVMITRARWYGIQVGGAVAEARGFCDARFLRQEVNDLSAPHKGIARGNRDRREGWLLPRSGAAGA